MSWDIEITPPEGFPDVNEPVQAFCHCPGNMYTAVMALTGGQLRHMVTHDEAISALKSVIAEIEKEDKGMFSNEYCVNADKIWSNSRETMKDWEMYKQYCPMAYDEYCGKTIRERIRSVAVRFMLYYVAGYKITYSW